MRKARCAALLLVPALILFASTARAGKDDGKLDVWWVDVEGGAATLVVTPAGESILIDTGLPGERDPGRIKKVVTEKAGLKKIDHVVATHFDLDHYGGTADLMKLIPVDHVWDPGLPTGELRKTKLIEDYVAATKGKRKVLKPGDVLPLKQGGKVTLKGHCLAANQKFVAPTDAQKKTANSVCAQDEPKNKDKSQNANSTVLLFEFGDFRFLDAADLTWNLEKQLVCPHDLVGPVDVFQVNHHGLPSSNNPTLLQTIKPTVAIMNNGHRKGGADSVVDALRASTKAIFQVHKNLNPGGKNTSPNRIANHDEACKAEVIHLGVSPDARNYEVSIPSRGLKEKFATKKGR